MDKPKCILRCITIRYYNERSKIELPFSKEQIIATMPKWIQTEDGKIPQITIWYIEKKFEDVIE